MLAARADAAGHVGTVMQIEMVGTRYALVRINGSTSGTRPGCHAGGAQQLAYSMDLNTVKGRALLSLASAAQLAGRSLEVYGGGTCLTVGTPYTDVEQIARMISHQ
jgi:hypothetical protein